MKTKATDSPHYQFQDCFSKNQLTAKIDYYYQLELFLSKSNEIHEI